MCVNAYMKIHDLFVDGVINNTAQLWSSQFYDTIMAISCKCQHLRNKTATSFTGKKRKKECFGGGRNRIFWRICPLIFFYVRKQHKGQQLMSEFLFPVLNLAIPSVLTSSGADDPCNSITSLFGVWIWNNRIYNCDGVLPNEWFLPL